MIVSNLQDAALKSGVKGALSMPYTGGLIALDLCAIATRQFEARELGVENTR